MVIRWFEGRVLVNVPPWSALNRVGQSRLLRTSYLWIVVVPIAANFLHGLQETLTVSLGETDLQLHLTLPFSWKVFYWSSLFIAVASAIYSLKCPFLVKRFDDFRQYEQSGRTFAELSAELAAILRMDLLNDENDAKGTALTFLSTFGTSEGLHQAGPGIFIWNVLSTQSPNQALQPSAFWYLHRYADHYALWSRRWCFALYSAGFFLIGVVLIQNCYSVLKMTF